MAVGVGVAGGALIGTGVGAPAGASMILAAAGTGVVVSAESYMINNSRTGESFDQSDFLIASAAGGLEGGLSAVVGPVASIPVSGIVAAGQTALSSVANGNTPDTQEVLWNGGQGLIAGATGSLLSGQKLDFSSLRNASYGIRGEAEVVDLMTPTIQNPAFLPRETLQSMTRTTFRDLAYGFGIDWAIETVSAPFSQ